MSLSRMASRERLRAYKNMGMVLVLWSVFACHALVLQGRVVKVADGDTITLLDKGLTQHKIRLEGIDAPEKNQAFGWRSKHTLGLLVFGKEVSVKVRKKDRYGRSLGKVMLAGQDINLAQLEAGWAWHYKAYEKEQSKTDRQLYAAAQRRAQSRRIGLWQDPKPVAPWDFRRNKR
jgi:endonuclease YncB( thermonuclease family)